MAKQTKKTKKTNKPAATKKSAAGTAGKKSQAKKTARKKSSTKSSTKSSKKTAAKSPPKRRVRKSRRKRKEFLIVVDQSEEMDVALRFAARRAANAGGQVAMLYVIDPPDFHHWGAVEDIMEQEAKDEARALTRDLAERVRKWTGDEAVIYIRQGDAVDAVMDVLEKQSKICLLVLASAAGTGSPGPIISALAEKGLAGLPVPVTVVPGGFDEERLMEVT